jgi:hypothetical protein
MTRQSTPRCEHQTKDAGRFNFPIFLLRPQSYRGTGSEGDKAESSTGDRTTDYEQVGEAEAANGEDGSHTIAEEDSGVVV